jgi:C4-dicarboxylate transporter, DctM subunit
MKPAGVSTKNIPSSIPMFSTLRKLAAYTGKGIDLILPFSRVLSSIMLLLMTFVTAYEVVARYLFNSPTSWSMELAIFLLIGFAYLSMAYVEARDRHIRVDIVITLFSPRTRWIWDIMTKIVFFIFALLLVYFTSEYFLKAYRTREYSWSMWHPLLWPVKLTLPIGTILLAINMLKGIVSKIHYLYTHSLERRRDVLDNPYVAIPIFLALIGLGVYLIPLSPITGIIFLVLVMLFGGVPIFAGLGLVGVVGFYLMFGGVGGIRASFPAICFLSLENFAFVCLPLFMLMGQLLEKSGVGKELFDLATAWVGHVPGGEAIATILACTIFAAISASSVATAATIGLVALPALAARKYDNKFSCGLLTAGGTLGIMIPPSGSMIIYSAVTEESLGRLFISGVIPGLILSGMFIIYIIFYAKHSRESQYERQKPTTWKEKYQATKTATWGLLAPVIVLGGMYSGLFTPLESGAMGVTYVIPMVLIRGKIKLKNFLNFIAESALASVMVLSIIIGALCLGDFTTLLKLPDQAMNFVASKNLQPWVVIVIIMAMYVVMGCFLELVSSMLITLPVIYPLITSLGFNGVWFAVMVTLNMEMAQITPPVGMNLYVISSIAHTKMKDVLIGVWPFFIIMVGAMIIFGLFPILSTWLPDIVVGH